MSRLNTLPLAFAEHFEPDNFDEISRKYFRDLRLNGSLYADPSGWIDTYSEAALQMPSISTTKDDYGRYYLDVAHTLEPHKTAILELLSQWEGTQYTRDEVTLCPSVSASSIIVLAALKALGVESLVLETPCYFATAEQAAHLNMLSNFVPTYIGNDFQMPEMVEILSKYDNIVFWITQPRASLGLNQNFDHLWGALSTLNAKSYLLIDEATDQTFPALLGLLRNHPNSQRLIKLKNFTKPMGLNGLRVAAILHDTSLKRQIATQIETFGGSIDFHSLKTIAALAGDIGRFRLMLTAANRQVIELRRQAEIWCRGTNATVLPLTNGYIGVVAYPIAKSKELFQAERHRFLAHFRDRATPVIIGPSMYFASDAPLEFVRLNYMSHPQHIIRGMEVLTDFSVC